MKKHKLAVSLLIAGGLVSPLAYATNGYFSQGYSMKEIGMAGAGIALPQDSLAAATNPAGMVMVGDRIDFGLDWFKPNRSATITGNAFPGVNGTYDGNGKSNLFIPDFGYNKMINTDMSLGVSIYGNGGMNTQYNNSPFTGFGGASPAGVNLEQLFISPTWAMKVNPSNAIGVSLNLVYQTFSATGLQPFKGISMAPNSVTNNGTDTSTGVGIKLGWTGEITPMVTLGATYQPKTKMSKFSNYSGLFADGGSFDIPATYGVGIAVKATSETTVAFDIQKILYSGVPAIANTATQGGPLGAANGAGFGWQDVTVYKLGLSQKMSNTLTVRGGVSHNTQPIPNNQTFFNILAPGVVQDSLTLGATWTLADKSEVTVGYMHAFKKTVNGSGSIAPGAPPGFGGGEANLTMSEDSLGVSYGW